MEIFGLGVLISGGSGIGKSELALELLSRGHRLIADDAAEFALDSDGSLIGHCPALLSGFLEVRGLGILNVHRMFGEGAIAAAQRLDLILCLHAGIEPDDEIDRINGRRGTQQVLDMPVAEITLSIRLGLNLAALTEAACRDQKLRLDGYVAADDFVERQTRAIRDEEGSR